MITEEYLKNKLAEIKDLKTEYLIKMQYKGYNFNYFRSI